jgi:hypothetical protein
MDRRAQWRKVLDAKTERWQEKSCDQLLDELHEHEEQNYQIVVDSKRYQVEVQLLEDTNEYVHVALGVDDGSFPWSISPATRAFIKQKDKSD